MPVLDRRGDKGQRVRRLAACVVAFFAVWTGYVALLYPWVAALGSETLAFALLNFALKALIWVAPVIVYLRTIDRTDPVAYLRLGDRWRIGLLFGTGLTLLNLGGYLLRFGTPRLGDAALTWNGVLSASLAVGFVEEIPFRGFLFAKLREVCGFWPANLLSSLLFLLIHLPGWLLLDDGAVDPAVAAGVFGLGVVLAAALASSRSLWSCIVAHDTNNFFAVVLFRL